MSALPVFPRAAYYERIGAARSLLPLLSTAPVAAAAASHAAPKLSCDGESCRMTLSQAPAEQTTAPQGRSSTVNLSFLQQLMLAHTTAIPFETLDVLLRRPISLARRDVYNKLIYAKRGGYCFEHNLLFYDAMRDAGFDDVRMVCARVLLRGPDSPLSRTHMLSIVTLPTNGVTETGKKEQWLVDVGFGSGLPRCPLRLHGVSAQHTITGTFCVRPRNAAPLLTGGWTEYVVEVRVRDSWRPMYHFDLQPQELRDLQMFNHYVQHASHFCGALHVSRCVGNWVHATPEGDATAAEEKMDGQVLTASTGYTYVSRGLYTAVVDRTCHTSSQAPISPMSASLLNRPEVGGALVPVEGHPSTTDALYDWMVESLGLDLSQSKYPQYTVSKKEFAEAAKRHLIVFGGTGFEHPARL